MAELLPWKVDLTNISMNVIQRSAQILLPAPDGCYWAISIQENAPGTAGNASRRYLARDERSIL
ncbi:hypothetical protein G3E53_001979 [Salmonella enterica subsp. enterica]|nr:hypothetical protein [Salmonella enterica]EDX0903180.1 hypothetical protein [Salmonella enterica subsp. enterica]EEG6050931.1 hypothetical protein [Salmonella enterica subsp. enterica]